MARPQELFDDARAQPPLPAVRRPQRLRPRRDRVVHYGVLVSIGRRPGLAPGAPSGRRTRRRLSMLRMREERGAGAIVKQAGAIDRRNHPRMLRAPTQGPLVGRRGDGGMPFRRQS